MQWVNEDLLTTLFDHVSKNPHSDFYKKKYGSAPMDLLHFSELPLLTRAELVETPLRARTHIAVEEVRFAAFTSGTSAQKPLMTLFGDVEDYHVEPSLGLAVSRPLIIYPPLNKNFSHTFIQQCRQAKRPVSPIFADFQNLQNSALVAEATECDSLFATPTIAVLFAPYAQALGISERFKLLALSSETVTSARRAQLQTLYPNARIATLYASSEIGQFVMGPCPHMLEKGESTFHIFPQTLAAAELIEGELVVTYGLNKAMPLIRYKTGDCFEEAERCVCSTPGPVLRWSHRGEVDRVRLNGVEFDIEEADRVFARLSRPTARYQVHFFENEKGETDIQVEIEDSALAASSGAEVVARALQQELLDSWKLSSSAVMRDAISRGLFSSFSVSIVPALSNVGTKTKRFIHHAR